MGFTPDPGRSHASPRPCPSLCCSCRHLRRGLCAGRRSGGMGTATLRARGGPKPPVVLGEAIRASTLGRLLPLPREIAMAQCGVGYVRIWAHAHAAAAGRQAVPPPPRQGPRTLRRLARRAGLGASRAGGRLIRLLGA